MGKTVEKAQWLNHAVWGKWFTQLYGAAIAAWQWDGLPDSVDRRFLEKTLFWQGRSLFFRDEIMGELALPMVDSGTIDVYGLPLRRTAIASNGYYRPDLTRDTSVIIWNNLMHTPDHIALRMYAQRLAEIDRTIDVNLNAQKTPIAITCAENEKVSIVGAYDRMQANVPAIISAKTVAPNISVLKTDAPYICDKLQTLKRQTLQEAFQYLGIEANTNEKAERLVSNEVTANLGGVEAMRNVRLQARRQAAEEINRRFNLNVTVDFRSGLSLARIMEGGAQDEPLYKDAGTDMPRSDRQASDAV